MVHNLVELTFEALKHVIDPELHLNIVDLGLIYDIEQTTPGHLHITMTLTTPGCPVGSAIQHAVKATALQVPGVEDVHVTLTFQPPWTPDMISEEGRNQLNAF